MEPLNRTSRRVVWVIPSPETKGTTLPYNVATHWVRIIYVCSIRKVYVWETKGAFNLWKGVDKKRLHSEAITDVSLATKMGVEPGEEITSHLRKKGLQFVQHVRILGHGRLQNKNPTPTSPWLHLGNDRMSIQRVWTSNSLLGLLFQMKLFRVWLSQIIHQASYEFFILELPGSQRHQWSDNSIRVLVDFSILT